MKTIHLSDHYDAEVYPNISTLVKLAWKLDTYNERIWETFVSFVSYFSQKRVPPILRNKRKFGTKSRLQVLQHVSAQFRYLLIAPILGMQ